MDTVRAVLFDFDYTLADSSLGVIDCVGFAARETGLPSPEPERIKQTIGLSLFDTFAYLWPDHFSEKNAGEFSLLFVKRADLSMAQQTRLFPGAAAAIKSMKVKVSCRATVFFTYST